MCCTPSGEWTSGGQGLCIFLSVSKVRAQPSSEFSVCWVREWIHIHVVLSVMYTQKDLGKLQAWWPCDFLLFFPAPCCQSRSWASGRHRQAGCQQDTKPVGWKRPSAQNVVEHRTVLSWACIIWEIIPISCTAFLEKLPLMIHTNH